MDKKKIRNYQILSAIFVFILGTLLHFTYEWSGESQVVGWFSAINESVWEHLKLVYFPMLLTTIIGFCYIGKNIPNFLCAKTLGIITAMLFIPIFFYTYTGIMGKSIIFIDIASFFVAVIIGEYVAYKRITNEFTCHKIMATVVLWGILACFIIFTYFAPHLEIFKDSVTGQYGMIER